MFSQKPLKLLETESFPEFQFVIDSCRFISQSNYLNNFNNVCDWLILGYFITPLFLAWKIKFFQPNAWGNDRILSHKTNKEASTVLCSVVKHLEAVEHSRSGGKHSTSSRVFPYTSFVLYRFLRALQQNRVQPRILHLLTISLPSFNGFFGKLMKIALFIYLM